MSEAPDRPLSAVLHSWFTFVTGCISLWWFLSEQSLVEKLLAGGLVVLVLHTILVAWVTRRRERVKHAAELRRLESTIRQLELERGSELRKAFGPGHRSARRQAA
jgi:ABC-type uncharacterized transport system involved in gliding motility auxiliary subunit